MRLVSGVERVEFITTVENRVADHRLRVLFPAERAEGVRAEGHYVVLHRSVGVPPFGPDWKEEPDPTHHTLGAVEAGGTVLFGKGLPEYEARHAGEGSEIALTLLRCVGWLSRDDLSTRPGHAGPYLATPEAQCQGTHRFEYALALEDGWLDTELVNRSHDYRFGLTPGPAGVPDRMPLSVAGEGFCLGALKGAEDGDGVILRLYNPSDGAATAVIEGDLSVEPCRLDEEPLEGPAPTILPGGHIHSYRLRKR